LEVEHLAGALTEAREQQVATAEILRLISSSPTDLQLVMDTVSERAARLCDASDAQIFRLDGGAFRLAASHGPLPPARQVPVTRGSVAGRAVIDRQTIHIRDIATEPSSEFPDSLAKGAGVRTVLAAPLLREGVPIGVIVIRRMEVRPFSDKQLALLQTFADQAVIAIENVRLLKETKEALEQQTATGEILRVISSSPTDIQPVLDAIAESAARLCAAHDAIVLRLDGDVLQRVSHYGPIAPPTDLVFPATRNTVGGRTVLDRRPIHVVDLQAETDEFPVGSTVARQLGSRTVLGVPLLCSGTAIGAIYIRRTEVKPFADSQIALLQTFAAQAVIAIENVRLFTELQTSNRELTTALDTQTATSDILRVISRSQTDVQPVFDAILASAVRLLQAYAGALTRVAGEQIELVALTSTDHAGETAVRAAFPQPLGYDGPHPQTVRARVPFNIAAAYTDSRIPERAQAAARARGYQSLVVIPMLRHDEAIGTISVNRREPGGFTDDEIALLKTFADQAVIAIENARLLSELQARTAELTRSVQELQALGEVSQALSSTLDLETVLNTIVSRASQLAGAGGCSIYEYDKVAEQFDLRATYNSDAEFIEALRAAPLRKGEGVMGRAAEMREPIQIPDITQPGAYQSSVRDTLIRFGYRALLSVPLLREDQIIGSLSFNRKVPGEFPAEVVDVLKTFATQSALAIQNARLFREIANKSRQLEAASRHKSEFLANMSHELRTPLNAIIGFSEVLAEKMFGDVNDKQAEYLQDILESGRHLLSLINDILDLSKIEAGHMELEPADFDLPGVIENALILVRERASRRGITLGSTIDERLGLIRGDERKVKQVLLNLLSNALKFTPEGGRIDVGGRLAGEVAEVSVTDTGIGIAPADQEAVFEEFRQVGAAERKAEGTGLGLALSRKFVELHGGRIWVQSEVGRGSTFTFTLPVRPWPAS
jgi:signal transduction histidine kinase